MTTEARHHTSGNLLAAIALAMTAGFTDAYLYRRVTPVFVANMSGNLIRLGVATGSADGTIAAAALVALAGFVVGAIAATSHLDVRVRRQAKPTPVPLLLFESALLGGVTLMIAWWHIGYSTDLTRDGAVVVALGSAAMGVQAVALRRVGQIAVSTTYGTGAVVRLGEKIALATRRSERPGDVRRRRTIVVLSLVLVSYVTGAAVASYLDTMSHLLVIAASVPAIVAVVSATELQRGPAGPTKLRRQRA